MIVNSDTVVPAAWLERLRAAAYSDGLVATASTLTNHGTILSVPDWKDPSPRPPAGLSITEADARIARASPRLHPRIPTGVGHCLYIRRAALELVGDFDEAFSPGYGEEVDFCQRCLARGLRHVVADDLYVFHHGGAARSAARAPRASRQTRTSSTAATPTTRRRCGKPRRRRPCRSRARWRRRGSRSASCR